jgi:hypothetical protein
VTAQNFIGPFDIVGFEGRTCVLEDRPHLVKLRA